MSPTKYVHEAVRNCLVHLSSNYGGKYRRPKKAKCSFKMGYDPELDTSPELDPNAVFYYLSVISILRWMIKLGRIDIITKVSLLSSHAALPREGNLEAAVHVMTLLVRDTILNWCVILCTQKYITVFLKNVIGRNFKGMQRRQYL